MRLWVTYAVLAALSMLANIGAQHTSISIYSGPLSIALSMVVGTGVGLVLKYVLDKRFIFNFKAKDVAHDSWTFMLYTGMGVITTFIFWGTELAFEAAFQSDVMRYTGAAIGLTIGYIIKYNLDKRFVFSYA